MKLEHSFTVPTGIEEAWTILLDIERIGPCMPGAAIDTVDGDDFTGTVKVKLGPIGLTYKGKASFVEKDAAAHRAVIDARGRDARGNGTAAAKVTATLEAQGSSTLVRVDTDLDITGKPAQFGRGVMVDVGNKLIGIFADNLAATIGEGADTAAAEAPVVASAPQPVPEPAEAVSSAATPARKRAARPKPGSAAAASEPAGTAEASGAADEAPVTDGTLADGDTSDSSSTSVTDASPEEPSAAEASALAGPIERAAVEAVAAAPAAYSAPATPADGASVGSGVNGHGSAAPSTSGPRAVPKREVEPIDLLESAGPAVAKRVAPLVAVVAVLLVLLRRRRHR